MSEITLIKIDKESIKKNPTAGNDKIFIHGPLEISFEIKGKFPEYLLIEKNIYLTHWNENYWKGYLIDHSLLDKLLLENNCTIECKKDIQVHRHLPEPQYLYKYEKTYLKCSNCSESILHSDIDIDYDYDGYKYETCPKCQYVNTFQERKYESITQALNNE